MNLPTVVFIGMLNKQLAICKVDSIGNVIGGQGGCYNLIPVFDWVRRCVVSIFLVFMVAFLPLFLQGQLQFTAAITFASNALVQSSWRGAQEWL